MKVSSSEVPPRQVALDIEVEQERLDRAMEHAYRRIANRVQVPGFRKGKAPRTMVERMVGRHAIVEDALEHLLPDIVNEAIEQEQVEAYIRPQVQSVELDPLRVRAIVPLAPSVKLGDYATALGVPREEVVVDEGQIDAVINRLRESHAQWVPVERPVQVSDRVGLDVKGEVAESRRVLLDSKDAEFLVDPEGPQPAPGFAEQLVGLSAGAEKTFTLVLAENYRESALAGKPVEFSVKIHWVKEKQLPEVDDVFAQQVGDYADVVALRGAVEAQLRQQEDERVRKAHEEAALDKLVELSTVEAPPQVIEHQTDHLLEVFTRNLEQQGLALEQYLRLSGKDRSALREEAHMEAEKRVKRALALDAFAKAEQIGVEQEEVEAEVKKATAQVEEPGAAEMLALGNPQTVARVEAALRERKALERLVRLAADSGANSSRPAGKRRESSAPSRSASDTSTGPRETAVTRAAGEAEEKP